MDDGRRQGGPLGAAYLPRRTDAEIESETGDPASLSTETGSYRELLSPLVRMSLFVGVGLAILQQVTGINTVIYYAPTIFNLAGIDSASSAILAGGGVALVNVVATIWALRLVSNHGRRTLLLVGVAGMTVSLLVLGAAFKLEGDGLVATVGAGSLMATSCRSRSASPDLLDLNGELYPARWGQAPSSHYGHWTFLIVSLTSCCIDSPVNDGTFWLYVGVSIVRAPSRQFRAETRAARSDSENDWRARVAWSRWPQLAAAGEAQGGPSIASIAIRWSSSSAD